jgi:hypothetical protein
MIARSLARLPETMQVYTFAIIIGSLVANAAGRRI